ncbi:glycosyltransferase [Tateyamaria sp. ANG-S1]|uniref:glycosyltransferase family protein n=1 Tax=Tateyamaria sp. ANG-S1 TaxID=1577905 RepID=UPI00057D0011|nr:glycosyltransferase [Tateyamaria sp. ANG-S1]KIC48229.1 glycosyltransferase [Tateyamaria sp. ANG-S1]
MQVTIIVTHLLGTGHLARALTLGRAFAAAGDAVTVVSGGRPVPHFDTTGINLVQLPSLHSDGTDFSNLLTDAEETANASYLKAREDALVAEIATTPPDVLITELFPFGRRTLKREFQAVLAAAKTLATPPLILSSIRDILAPPSKPEKVSFADDLIASVYDGVLVHSDADVVALQDSWPVGQALNAKLHYTGFVAPPAPVEGTEITGDIVVSAGGGAVGDAVFHAALDAARHDPSRSWHMLVGGDAARRGALSRDAPANVTVEGPRPDFRQLLMGARVSVSMCGYNTALDVLQTGVRAVLVPFDDGGEVEQTLRAGALDKLPGIAVIRQAVLTGDTLLRAIADATSGPERPRRSAGMDGAAQTVEIVHDLQRRRADGY